ncbi:hypothetical protein ACVWYH_010464 [Bradyrhizobium sp. GM24.11]
MDDGAAADEQGRIDFYFRWGLIKQKLDARRDRFPDHCISVMEFSKIIRVERIRYFSSHNIDYGILLQCLEYDQGRLWITLVYFLRHFVHPGHRRPGHAFAPSMANAAEHNHDGFFV